MLHQLYKTGFIADDIKQEDYLFGSGQLQGQVLRVDGQWTDYLPEAEYQSRGSLETNNCVGFNTLNAIEILLQRQFNRKSNNSERYLGIVANTDPSRGNSPQTVAESLRNVAGCIDDHYLPFAPGMTLEEYYSPKPMTENYLIKGREWLKQYTFKHDWTFQPWEKLEVKRAKMIEALKYSPLGVSVVAWVKKGDYYIKPEGVNDGHWTVCVGYKLGEYWIIYDSYDPTIKHVHWDYNFGYSKRYSIDLGGSVPKESYRWSLMSIIESFRQIVRAFQDYVSTIAETTLPVGDPDREGLPPPETYSAEIDDLALAIRSCEGWREGTRSWRNNNPGNLKYTALTKELGAINQDNGGFCIFSSPANGLKALCDFLKLARDNKLKMYRGQMSLSEFVRVYVADANNESYLKNLTYILKLPPTTKLREFL